MYLKWTHTSKLPVFNFSAEYNNFNCNIFLKTRILKRIGWKCIIIGKIFFRNNLSRENDKKANNLLENKNNENIM